MHMIYVRVSTPVSISRKRCSTEVAPRVFLRVLGIVIPVAQSTVVAMPVPESALYVDEKSPFRFSSTLTRWFDSLRR